MTVYDTLYGITGPFLAIGAAVLTFYAFWVQYVYNIEQKDDLTVERFEHNLFEMISHQEAITNALSIELDEEIDGGVSVSWAMVVRCSSQSWVKIKC